MVESQAAEDHHKSDVHRRSDIAYMYPQKIWFRRFEEKDLLKAVGTAAERRDTVAYVCGPPEMTDWAVTKLKEGEGMQEEKVLCEKWW